jgi:uncharacterized protein Yka (UPF0111/DUF47 family)
MSKVVSQDQIAQAVRYLTSSLAQQLDELVQRRAKMVSRVLPDDIPAAVKASSEVFRAVVIEHLDGQQRVAKATADAIVAHMLEGNANELVDAIVSLEEIEVRADAAEEQATRDLFAQFGANLESLQRPEGAALQ